MCLEKLCGLNNRPVLHVESGNRSHNDDVQRYALPSGFIVLGGVPDMPAF